MTLNLWRIYFFFYILTATMSMCGIMTYEKHQNSRATQAQPLKVFRESVRRRALKAAWQAPRAKFTSSEICAGLFMLMVEKVEVLLSSTNSTLNSIKAAIC